MMSGILLAAASLARSSVPSHLPSSASSTLISGCFSVNLAIQGAFRALTSQLARVRVTFFFVSEPEVPDSVASPGLQPEIRLRDRAAANAAQNTRTVLFIALSPFLYVSGAFGYRKGTPFAVGSRHLLGLAKSAKMRFPTSIKHNNIDVTRTWKSREA